MPIKNLNFKQNSKFQDAPEGVHKPADGQLNKSSHSSSNVLPDTSSSSRRSSSAPLTHHQNHQNRSENNAQGSNTTNSVGTTTEKTNAETQTALRGVAILENTECRPGYNCNGENSPRDTVFFTECECKRKTSASSSSAGPKKSRRTAAGGAPSGVGPKHSISTPNMTGVGHAPRPSRKDKEPKKVEKTDIQTKVRNYSLSPARRSELPGSPDDAGQQATAAGQRTKRRNTVVSPIHKPIIATKA